MWRVWGRRKLSLPCHSLPFSLACEVIFQRPWDHGSCIPLTVGPGLWALFRLQAGSALRRELHLAVLMCLNWPSEGRAGRKCLGCCDNGPRLSRAWCSQLQVPVAAGRMTQVSRAGQASSSHSL